MTATARKLYDLDATFTAAPTPAIVRNDRLADKAGRMFAGLMKAIANTADEPFL